MNEFDIDFIIPWVDGSDPEWIKEFNKYAPENSRLSDSRAIRFRDTGLLKYWFRAVEKFAPWVHTVHFVTNGQLPEWINSEYPKLHFVKHSDYIPQEYLPVFSSHPIELMMHKIPGLAEHFVYFNDDLFLTAPIKKEYYFKKGLICDIAILNVVSNPTIPHIVFNNVQEINKNFVKKDVIKKNFFKWYNPVYGKEIIRTICLRLWKRFCGFIPLHYSRPYTISLFNEVWEKCEPALSSTMKSRFRSITDVNQWLFRYWNLCKGNFTPVSPHRGQKFIDMNQDVYKLCDNILKGKYKEVCINDEEADDYENKMKAIVDTFEKMFPQKSSFEK